MVTGCPVRECWLGGHDRQHMDLKTLLQNVCQATKLCPVAQKPRRTEIHNGAALNMGSTHTHTLTESHMLIHAWGKKPTREGKNLQQECCEHRASGGSFYLEYSTTLK